MKKIFLLSLILFSGNLAAETVSRKGKIVDILIRTNAPFHSIFYVSGISSVGTCPVHRNHVMIAVPDDEKTDERYMLLLALYMSDKEVHVKIDDTKTTSDKICIVQDIRINKDF